MCPKGYRVFNTPCAHANGVKELVIVGTPLLARDVVGGIEWVRIAKQHYIAKAAEKEKKKFAGTEVMGKKLGVIGLGVMMCQGGQYSSKLLNGKMISRNWLLCIVCCEKDTKPLVFIAGDK